jgi:hypothetical protein
VGFALSADRERPCAPTDHNPARNRSSTRATTNAGREAGALRNPRFATSGADDPGALNAVVTARAEALLFVGRGYADPVPQARPGSRFDLARGLLAANACALPFANSATAPFAR